MPTSLLEQVAVDNYASLQYPYLFDERGMSMLRWFDATEARQFAETAVDEFVRLRKSTALRGDSAAKKAEKFSRLRTKINNYAAGLNVYKKAKFIQELRSELEANAIPQEEITEWMQSLITAPLSSERKPSSS